MYDKNNDSWILMTHYCMRDSIMGGAGSDAIVSKLPTDTGLMSRLIEANRNTSCCSCASGGSMMFGYNLHLDSLFSWNNSTHNQAPLCIRCSTLGAGFIKCGTPGCFCGYIKSACACATNCTVNQVSLCVTTAAGCFTNCATPLSIVRACGCNLFSSAGNHAEGLYTYGSVNGGAGHGGGRSRIVGYLPL